MASERDGKVTKYEYDAAGRLVKEGEKVYDYIGLDKLSSVSENGRELSSFSYDISGQLAEAVTPEKSESFYWDGLALIQRDSTCYVNEPSITGGNPILADGRVLFNDMLFLRMAEFCSMTCWGRHWESKRGIRSQRILLRPLVNP